MPQKGEHTWDMVIRYHRCPSCGYINESRLDFEYRLGGIYQKDLECFRCKSQWTLTLPRNPTFGPLIGDPQPPEFEWND